MCYIPKAYDHKTTVRGTGHPNRKHVKPPPPTPADPPKPSTIEYAPLNRDLKHGASFAYEWSAGGWFNQRARTRRVVITRPSDWVAANIVPLETPDIPLLTSAKFHRLVAPQFRALFKAAAVRGLASRILSQVGGLTLRTITGNSATLSNHALGTAIDINSGSLDGKRVWNPYGGPAAQRGAEGSNCELADLCADFGIYWGGWYSKHRDPMHFEAVRVLEDDELRSVCSAYDVDWDRLILGQPEPVLFSVGQTVPFKETPAPAAQKM